MHDTNFCFDVFGSLLRYVQALGNTISRQVIIECVSQFNYWKMLTLKHSLHIILLYSVLFSLLFAVQFFSAFILSIIGRFKLIIKAVAIRWLIFGCCCCRVRWKLKRWSNYVTQNANNQTPNIINFRLKRDNLMPALRFIWLLLFFSVVRSSVSFKIWHDCILNASTKMTAITGQKLTDNP